MLHCFLRIPAWSILQQRSPRHAQAVFPAHPLRGGIWDVKGGSRKAASPIGDEGRNAFAGWTFFRDRRRMLKVARREMHNKTDAEIEVLRGMLIYQQAEAKPATEETMIISAWKRGPGDCSLEHTLVASRDIPPMANYLPRAPAHVVAQPWVLSTPQPLGPTHQLCTAALAPRYTWKQIHLEQIHFSAHNAQKCRSTRYLLKVLLQ